MNDEELPKTSVEVDSWKNLEEGSALLFNKGEYFFLYTRILEPRQLILSQGTMSPNEDLIKRLFNKVYSAILNEKIFCPPQMAVILAAYACQAKFGSAKAICNPAPPVKELLSKSILENHDLTIEQWETKISSWHMKLQGVSELDAIVEYLDIAQDIELYGASIYDVESKSKNFKRISLDSVGLNIYEKKRKPPSQRYLWSDILSFTAVDDSKLEIILMHNPNEIVELFVSHKGTTELIAELFRGSKELYEHRKKSVQGLKYLRRSESNCSVRMKRHKLSSAELHEIAQRLTEMELELPRRATNFEFAPWQVKDQMRQARNFEAKLALSIPTTDFTRSLQRKAVEIRIFLEKDAFNACEEENDSHRRYRGNFAIRVGGAYQSREGGYSSDIDSENATTRGSPTSRTSGSQSNNIRKNGMNTANIIEVHKDKEAVYKAPPSTDFDLYKPEGFRPKSDSPFSSLQTTFDRHTPEDSKKSDSSFGELGKNSDVKYRDRSSSRDSHSKYPSGDLMPTRPKPYLSPFHSMPLSPTPPMPSIDIMPPMPKYPSPTSSRNPIPIMPKYPSPQNDLLQFASPELPQSAHDSSSLMGRATTNSSRLSSRQSLNELEPTVSPSQWQSQLKITDQTSRGRMHGQVIHDSESLPNLFRPPIQPKPKVTPRVVAAPLTVTPDPDDDGDLNDRRRDPKFSSINRIQKGLTKKRVDLFEAL